ncbi:MAG TPA: hypothetical protein VGP61_13720 [Gemmatimonadales bacterium]|nr:hypothetical protein [Gemmatimonadales bacterium]
MMARRWIRTFMLAVGLFPLTAHRSPLTAQGRPPSNRAPDPPRFRFMGPASGGRIAAVAGVPGDSLTLYFGSASGGVWKSTDGGQTTTPVFDAQPVQAIGALAVAPSDPKIVWAGTGEAWAIRDADVMGDGVYKSTDAGTTWTNMGLRETGRIGRIILHPGNPDIVYVCALGRATGPQQERGVYRTQDGGKSWERVLFVDPNTGCSGLTMDAKDPNVLFAGMWDMVMHTWAMFSGGPGSSLHVSRDGGTTWTRLSDPGLPKSPVGKIDVAIAPSNSSRVYALIQTPNQGSLWRSDDGGATWRVASWDRSLIGRAGYYIRLAVNPANADEVLVANSSFHRSLDGGLTFPIPSPGGGGGGGGGGCGDCHDIWMDAKNPNRWAVTGDGGAGITLNHGRTFSSVTLPNGQMYHVAVDNRVPYWMYSNRQDNGTMRGPSTVPETSPNRAPPAAPRGGQPDSLVGRDSMLAANRARPDSGRARSDTTAGGGEVGGFGFGGGSTWDHGIGGCESGFTLPDPADYHVVWATCYGNKVTRYDDRTGLARSVSPWMHTLDSPPDAIKYRCHWTAPLAIDPFDHNAVYYGCQVIFKTVNGGQSWSVLSPDLSTRDRSRIVSSGGVVGDNLGQFYGEVVFAIAPSEIQKGLLWAGTNDGKLWYTRDGGLHWQDVGANVGMPAWGTIRKIEPSHFDPGTAYVAVDYHLMDDRKPYLYKTTDFGKSWTRLSDALPQDHPLDYAMAIAENPNRKGMLFAGTGHGFYYSLDDGKRWVQFKDGLPAAPVSWIATPKLPHDVVVSTYGRGLFLLRDISMLEQQDKLIADAPLQLYAPRPAFREARSGSVDVNFNLKAAPKDSVKVEVLDAAGAVIRTMRATGRVGLNRVTWDLRYDGPKQVELRTTPPDNPRIWDEPRYKGKTTRAISHWGIQGPQRAGPLVLAGKYSVRVTAGEQTASQPVTVLRDPDITTSELDLAASLRTQLRIRDAINATAEIVNRVEVMRKQIEDQLKTQAGQDGTGEALRALDQKMLDVELRLVSRTELHSDDKWFVEPYKVYLNLVWLLGEVGTGAGDVAGGAEFRPTDAELATLAEQEKQLAAAKAQFEVLLTTVVPAFNQQMTGKLAPIAEKQTP